MAELGIHTYHCICNELVVAICGTLQDAPRRSRDKASVCTIASPTAPAKSSAVLASSMHTDNEAVVLKLEDGFEKRYALRCGRCEVQIGYMLDEASFEDSKSGRKTDVVYLLPGGLMSTDEMREAKDMSKEAELVAGTAD